MNNSIVFDVNPLNDLYGLYPINDLRCDQINVRPLQAFGSVRIVTFPVGANIFIDNILQQPTTPAVINNLPSGSHTYKLTLPGYLTVEGSIVIIPGQTLDLTIVIESQPRDITGLLLASFAIGLLGLYLFTRRRREEVFIPARG